MFKPDQPFGTELQMGLAILIWILGATLFASGLSASYPFEDIPAEVMITTLIVVAEAACLFNFLRNKTVRNFVTIAQLTAWGICFWLRRSDLIEDGVYGVLIAVFVVSVFLTVRGAMRAKRR